MLSIQQSEPVVKKNGETIPVPKALEALEEAWTFIASTIGLVESARRQNAFIVEISTAGGILGLDEAARILETLENQVVEAIRTLRKSKTQDDDSVETPGFVEFLEYARDPSTWDVKVVWR